jgi:hypothetical protein
MPFGLTNALATFQTPTQFATFVNFWASQDIQTGALSGDFSHIQHQRLPCQTF